LDSSLGRFCRTVRAANASDLGRNEKN
jgi:hypothetical protein